MPVQFKIDPAKLRRAQSKLRTAASRIKDLTTPHKQIGVWLGTMVDRNFVTEGREFAGGWEPLKAGGRWISGKGLDTSAKILRDTGRLMGSFFPVHITSRTVKIGSDLPYAAPHHEGMGRLPARRLIPEKEQIVDDVIKIYENHVKRSVRDVK